MKIPLLAILFSLCQLVSAQEPKTGVINDPDGYTNIRAGKGTSTEIIDTIFDYEVFEYTAQPNEQWLEVTVIKCACENHTNSYSRTVKGYVHRSKISNLSAMNNSLMKEKLTKLFNHELELYNSSASLTDRQSNDFKVASNRWAVFHEMMFAQVLSNFSDYICSTKDEQLFNLYNKIITTETGSADEAPSFAIGRVFKCQPDWTLERIPTSHDYFNLLERGCQGVTDKEQQRLLNEHRTNIGLEQVDYDSYEY